MALDTVKASRTSPLIVMSRGYHSHTCPDLGANEARDNTPTISGQHRWWLDLMLIAMLVLLATMACSEYFGWPFLRAPLTRQLSSTLHHQVHLKGSFKLRLLMGLRLQSEAMVVEQPTWLQDARPLLLATNLDVSLPYRSLWHLIVERNAALFRIDAIHMDRLEAILARDARGRANWSLEEQGQTSTMQPSEKTVALPRVGRLQVSSGLLELRDRTLDLDLRADWHTVEGEAYSQGAQGTGLRFMGDGLYRGNPFEVSLKALGALPLLAEPHSALAAPIAIHAKARHSELTFEGVSRDVLSLGSLDGALTVSGPSLAAIGDAVGVTLPTTAPFSLKGKLNKDGGVWRLQASALHVGSSRLSGQFTFDRRPSVPVLSGELLGNQFALYDLGPAFGAPVNGAPNPKPPSGLVLPQKEFDIPSLHAMNAQIKVRLQRVSLGQFFALPLKPLDGDLTLQSGVLRISHLDAVTAGGRLGGQFTMDARNGARLLWDADLRWSGIDLARWLNAPNAAIKDASASGEAGKSYVSGTLAGQAKLKGEGKSTATLLGSMTGRVDIWVNHGQMSHLLVEAMSLHVAESLGLIMLGDALQPMHCAAARLSANRGVIRPDVAIIDTPHATILVSGAVSLAQEKLALTLTSQPKRLSPLSLRTPIDLTGTFASPHVSLHAKPLSLKLGTAAALSVMAPFAVIVPLIDVGEGKEGGCALALKKLQGEKRQPVR